MICPHKWRLRGQPGTLVWRYWAKTLGSLVMPSKRHTLDGELEPGVDGYPVDIILLVVKPPTSNTLKVPIQANR